MNLDQTVSAALEALRRGAFAEAEARSRSVLEIYPSHFLCLLILGDVSAHAGRAEEALQLYKKAARVNPGDSIAFTRAGTMQFRAALGSPVAARVTPKAALRIQMTTLGTKGRFGNQLLQ